MSILGIILLILGGIFLLLLEFLVVPGITIAGIGGLLMMGGAVYLAFSDYGVAVGVYTLSGTLISLVVSITLALRSKTWNRFMLNSEIKSHAFDKSEEETTEERNVQAGDEGVTVSRLNPIGKVLVKENYLEAKSLQSYIEPNTPVIVTKVFPNQIVVKPKNE